MHQWLSQTHKQTTWMRHEAHSGLLIKGRNISECPLEAENEVGCTFRVWPIVHESIIHESVNKWLHYTCKLRQRWMIALGQNYSQGCELGTCSSISIPSVKEASNCALNIFLTVMISSLMCTLGSGIRRWGPSASTWSFRMVTPLLASKSNK